MKDEVGLRSVRCYPEKNFDCCGKQPPGQVTKSKLPHTTCIHLSNKGQSVCKLKQIPDLLY